MCVFVCFSMCVCALVCVCVCVCVCALVCVCVGVCHHYQTSTPSILCHMRNFVVCKCLPCSINECDISFGVLYLNSAFDTILSPSLSS